MYFWELLLSGHFIPHVNNNRFVDISMLHLNLIMPTCIYRGRTFVSVGSNIGVRRVIKNWGQTWDPIGVRCGIKLVSVVGSNWCQRGSKINLFQLTSGWNLMQSCAIVSDSWGFKKMYSYDSLPHICISFSKLIPPPINFVSRLKPVFDLMSNTNLSQRLRPIWS